MDNKQRINENTAKIEALAQRLEEFSFKEPTLITKEITENGTYNASDDNADGYVSVVVNVAGGGSGTDMLQARVDSDNSCAYLFANYKGTNVDFIENLDTSNVTNMSYMFDDCSNITTIPQLDTSNVTDMSYMFSNCKKLTTIPQLNTSKVGKMSYMFYDCPQLTTIPQLDMIKVSTASAMFNSSPNITNLTLKNIKKTLTIGSDTSYGTLLTDESIINTAKELWDKTGSTAQTLTVSTTSNARLDAIYVKLVDVTDEMIAEDEYISNKKPCVVCESTDTGAMTLREYIISKNWSIA